MKQILDTFFIFITSLGDNGYIWIALIIGLLIYKPTRKFGVLCALALISEFFINDFVLKNVIARERPFIQNNIELLIEEPSGYSMPSGHSASSFVMASMFILFKQKGRIIVLVLATLMAISRVYLNVHFVSDIMVGALVGFVVAWIIYQKYSISINLS
jgi:undecaprenyl-diphosphatase